MNCTFNKINVLLKLTFLSLLTLFTFHLEAKKTIKSDFKISELRVEPTFWWTNMNNQTLQIMLHGNNISKYDVNIEHKGVEIIEKTATNNPNYIFLYLNIDKKAEAGVFDIVLKNGKSVRKIAYELKARQPNSAQRESFSEKDNVYLVMPDRFVNGDTTNDFVEGYHQGVDKSDLAFRQGGDIEGIIQKLPYLSDLGITALWTTPLFDNNDTEYSYHHYACTDYYKIDPRFGDNADYLRLSEKAAEHDIKMIIDVVPNHCGIEHWWVNDTPDSDWFHNWEHYTPSNYRITGWTDPYSSKADMKQLTKGWFSHNMPDLNLENPLLFDYLKQVYIFWIEYAKIAGMRVDTYPYNDIHTASKFVKAITNEYPKMNVVGECWVKSPSEIAYYQSGNNNKDGFESNLQSVMDFVLKDKLQEFNNEDEGWETGTAKLYSHFAQDFVYPNPNLIMNFVDNHDIDRLSTATKGDIDKYKMALAILMTTRGYPQIYYGTEIMLEGKTGDYQGHRFNFPGGWKDDKRNAFEAKGRTDSENEIFDYLKKLLNYRKENKVLQSGKMMHFIPENGIYVYFRYDEERTVMVITNNNNENKKLDTKRFEERFKDYEMGVDIISRMAYDIKEAIEIEGKSVLVLQLGHWL